MILTRKSSLFRYNECCVWALHLLHSALERRELEPEAFRTMTEQVCSIRQGIGCLYAYQFQARPPAARRAARRAARCAAAPPPAAPPPAAHPTAEDDHPLFFASECVRTST